MITETTDANGAAAPVGADQKIQVKVLVKRADGGAVGGASVLAADGAGTNLTEITNDTDGAVTLKGAPGGWTVRGWHPDFGFGETYAPLNESGGLEIDLQPVSARLKVAGSVTWQGSRERVEGALVKVMRAPGSSSAAPFEAAWTDVDGRFVFKDGLPPGKYSFTLLHDDALPPAKPSERLILRDQDDVELEAWREGGAADQKWGMGFLIGLIVLLIALAAAYIGLHAWLPRDRSTLPGSLLAGRMEEMVTRLELRVSAKQPISDTTTLAYAAGVGADWTVISNTVTALTAEEREAVATFLVALEGAVKSNQPEAARRFASTLKTRLGTLSSREWWWRTYPLWGLEVMMWSLAGVIIHLVITTAYYCRWHRFYREGLYQHVAMLVVTPVLALALIFLLASTAVTISLGDASNVTLDLSEPWLLAATSLMIGLQPWSLWRFLRSTSNQLLARSTPASQSG